MAVSSNFVMSAYRCTTILGSCGLSKFTFHPRDSTKVCIRNKSFKSGGDGVFDLNQYPVHSYFLNDKGKSVASYFNDKAIDEAAAKQSVRLKTYIILYSARDSAHVLKSAQYLQKELPIRIARTITQFRSLPFIIGCNPTILSVHELYIKAFYILTEFPKIQTREDESRYSKLLVNLLDAYKDVVTELANGFKECRRKVDNEDAIRAFLDKTLTSRLGIRMLAMHHLSLRDEKPNHVGIINVQLQLKSVVEKWADFTRRIAFHRYGRAPEIRLSGHVHASFPYIQLPLDYILPELLKNAVRATVESHPNPHQLLPAIYVTIANNDRDFIIRISDRGGGISHDLVSKVLQYNFTTAAENSTDLQSESMFSGFLDIANSSTGCPMFG
ncbi:hypothetical protein QYM36_001824 [Artemia franciscana]|uniref:Protein-serine/threonine kinase n=2 Tax=Artemia franciscana TaxID=6661 RepID=A0AA88L9E5_ARTSF|nr:hypothetical protein QYM36_001824 [Artemia franciscana]